MNKVMIISGDPLIREKNLSILAEAGFEVDTASDYPEGIKKIGSNGLEVIIIDEELPDMDIYQTCSNIRQFFKKSIILVASEAEEKMWARVEDLGFDYYLRKPVSPRELIARVEAACRRLSSEAQPSVPGDKRAAILASDPNGAVNGQGPAGTEGGSSAQTS